MSVEYDDVLTNQPVVIDNVCVFNWISTYVVEHQFLSKGSGTIKAGFAGQDHPKCFFPSLCVSVVESVVLKTRVSLTAYI